MERGAGEKPGAGKTVKHNTQSCVFPFGLLLVILLSFLHTPLYLFIKPRVCARVSHADLIGFDLIFQLKTLYHVTHVCV